MSNLLEVPNLTLNLYRVIIQNNNLKIACVLYNASDINKEIEIIIHDVGTETDYLAANQNNHKFLLRQIAFVKKNKGLKTRI